MVFPTHVSLLCRENRDEVSDVYVCVFFFRFSVGEVSLPFTHTCRYFCGFFAGSGGGGGERGGGGGGASHKCEPVEGKL